MEQDLISVIIPLYNTEKYIERCINSIMENSYKNLEVIVVDDGSTDGGVKIVKNLQEQYSNLRLVPHEKNMGLFQARITGFEASKGKYITYVDSDDYVTVDWFRLLHKTITENKSDIAVGQFILDYEGVDRVMENIDPLRQKLDLSGDEVADAFFGQKGIYYSWHIVVTKIYKRELWQSALEDVKAFSKANPKLVMCEDMAFSTALWSRAKKVSNFQTGACYYYFKHEGQSTQVVHNKERNTRNITNITKVFGFMEQQLKNTGLYEKHKDNFVEWKTHYARMYYNNFGISTSTKSYYKKLIATNFGLEPESFTTPAESTVPYVTTLMNPNIFYWHNYMKEIICNEKIKVVSFDIFDTLIVRPFVKPLDLFKLLSKHFFEIFNIKAYFDFPKARVEAEQRARIAKTFERSGIEEITLDEIYAQLEKDYGLNKKSLEELKQKEIELEQKLCYTRNYGKELFELAKSQNKTVILTSDMYLPKDVIENILKNNGFDGYDHLFLSSDVGVTKHSGNLYKHVTKTLGFKAKEFLHFGDNWSSDVANAQTAGWNSCHLPKAMDIFTGNNGLIYGGNMLEKLKACSGTQDLKEIENIYIGYSAMIGLIANKLYDDPYVYYNLDTVFNSDPFNVGYAALGPYLYAITDWVKNNAKDQQSNTIHFVARDGYMPMQAYELFRKFDSTLPKSNYLYLSRKSTAFADILKREDVLSLSSKINAWSSSPEKLVKLFRPYLPEDLAKADNKKIYKLIGVDEVAASSNFNSKIAFEQTALDLYDLIDTKKIQNFNKMLKAYFKSIIKPGDIMFDIGYSGRQEAVLSGLLGFPVNSLYIHTNSEAMNNRAALAGFNTKLFYDHKPTITGLLREHAFMKLAPSTTGYKEVNGKLEPEFEKFSIDVASEIVTKTMQKAALEFVEDFLSKFDGYLDIMHYRKDDFAFTFEYYLHYSSYGDKKIFGGLMFEDDLGMGKKLNVLDFWQNMCEQMVQPHYAQQPEKQQKRKRKPFSRKVLDFVLPKGTRRREYFRHIYCNMTNQIYVSPFEQKPKKNKKK